MLRSRLFVWLLLLSSAGSSFAACLPDGVQSSGAKYRICVPEQGKWNGNLVVYAHGYVAFNEPVAIPEDQLTLPDGTSVPDLINGLGFAFAVSSYSVNGLAVRQGMDDLADLVAIFTANVGRPEKAFLVGPSEGGIITALSIEKRPDVWNAGLAACGPIGSFRTQVDYLGDFRVLFDYFYPGVLPGNAADIPQELIDNWDSVYVPKVKAAISGYPRALAQLLRVANAPIGTTPETIEETVLGVLWYSTFSTNDAKQKLGGLPFDNSKRIYIGSENDIRLNVQVDRFTADSAALQEMSAHYETSGTLTRPLVTLHTTGDPIIPYWHEPIFALKNLRSGTGGQHTHFPVLRYGHCNFNVADVLLAFVVMLVKESGQQMSPAVVNTLPASRRDDFTVRARAFGLLK